MATMVLQFLTKRAATALFSALLLFLAYSCSSSSKPPIEKAIKEKLVEQGYSLISYNIESAEGHGSYYRVKYSATVETSSSQRIQKRDSILFDQTGDGIWVYR